MDDQELYLRLKAQDPAAQDELVRRFQARLLRASRYLLGPRDPDCEDVVQETFIIALKQAAKPHTALRSNLYGWLNAVCMHLCFERIRKRKRLVASEQAAIEALIEARAAEEPGPDARLAREQLLARLRGELARLGAACRRLLGWRDQEGLAYAVIAERLDVPIGTVMSRLARCRQALKDRFLRGLP